MMLKGKTWKMVHLGRNPKKNPLCASTIAAEAQRVQRQQRSGNRQRHRQFVADHLRRTAQAAQQRIFIVRRPSGERHAVHAQAGNAEDEQHADIEIGQLHRGGDGRNVHRAEIDRREAQLGAERNHGDGNQREQHRDKWRQKPEHFVHVGRHHVFLGDQLDDVGQRLQQSVRTHAPRSDAQLDVSQHLALQPLQVRERGQQNEGHHRGFDDGQNEEIHRRLLPLPAVEFARSFHHVVEYFGIRSERSGGE